MSPPDTSPVSRFQHAFATSITGYAFQMRKEEVRGTQCSAQRRDARPGLSCCQACAPDDQTTPVPSAARVCAHALPGPPLTDSKGRDIRLKCWPRRDTLQTSEDTGQEASFRQWLLPSWRSSDRSPALGAYCNRTSSGAHPYSQTCVGKFQKNQEAAHRLSDGRGWCL